MTETQLIELVRKVLTEKTESQTLELKAAASGCPTKLYDSISAFANQDDGGILLFGIDEDSDWKICGVYDAQDLQKKVNEQCKQMFPVVRPVFCSALVDGKTVVSAEIPAVDLSERPCYYSGKGKIKGSFVRVGDSDEPMTDYEIYSYEAFRKKYEDDVRENEKATLEAIDLKKMNEYLGLVKENTPNLAKLPEETVLKLTGLVKNDHPTLLCTLLFSFFPQLFYPQYTINATVIPGTQRGDATKEGLRFLDNQRIEGTLVEMLEKALKFAVRNMKNRTIIDPQTGKRVDRLEYPLTAVREAILNALIHRDYSVHTEAMPIEMTFFQDRMEIRNPGGLYGRLTLSRLGEVQPDTRNPKLARALETLKITENRYSGIPTIQREMREAGLDEATFEDSRNEFCVTFFNSETSAQSRAETSPEKELLKFCQTPRSRQEIADFLGIQTISYVKKILEPLLTKGALKMTLPEKPKSKNQRFYS